MSQEANQRSRPVATRAAQALREGVSEIAQLRQTGLRGLLWRSTCQTDYRTLPMRVNAMALMLNVILSAALGYPFWLLAARVFDADAVGIGAGATSAMRLSAQFALLGLNATVITMLPSLRRHTEDLMRSFFTMVLVAALAVNSIFLLVGSFLLVDLAELAQNPGYAVGFVILSLLWTFSVAIDAVLLAIKRADRILVRSLIQGVVSIVVLATTRLAFDTGGVAAIIIAWTIALTCSTTLGLLQLSWHLPRLPLRPALRWRSVKVMLSVGLPNYRLSLALLAQIWILPILVAELLGTSAAAYWYAVWMFGVLVMIVPGASAQALFSQAAGERRNLGASVRQSVATALAIGLPMAAIMIVAADLVLSFMGADYAREGVAPLRIIALGVLPRTFIETYVAVRRATRNLTEPALLAGATSALALTGAAVGALEYGLVGVAAGWLIAQTFGGIVAAARLVPLLVNRPSPAARPLQVEPSGH